MRPGAVSKFMDWRDQQPEYREALREVLAYAEEAERRGEEEDEALERAWKEARAKLLAVERALLARWEARRGGD